MILAWTTFEIFILLVLLFLASPFIIGSIAVAALAIHQLKLPRLLAAVTSGVCAVLLFWLSLLLVLVVTGRSTTEPVVLYLMTLVSVPIFILASIVGWSLQTRPVFQTDGQESIRGR